MFACIGVERAETRTSAVVRWKSAQPREPRAEREGATTGESRSPGRALLAPAGLHADCADQTSNPGFQTTPARSRTMRKAPRLPGHSGRWGALQGRPEPVRAARALHRNSSRRTSVIQIPTPEPRTRTRLHPVDTAVSPRGRMAVGAEHRRQAGSFPPGARRGPASQHLRGRLRALPGGGRSVVHRRVRTVKRVCPGGRKQKRSRGPPASCGGPAGPRNEFRTACR